MHRSLVIAAALLFLLTAFTWAQNQPPSSEPENGSGTPQTPIANPQPADTAGNTTPAPSSSMKTGAGSAQPAPESTSTTAPPPMPKTEILDSSATSGGLTTNGHDPILDPPPLPSGSTTLVGGIIRNVDRIRNRMVIKVFGGGKWKISFDERTHIFRNGAEATQLALTKGERVYVDTMLDPINHNILARNIRLGVAAPPANASGQVTSIDTAHGQVSLRDNINSVPVYFGVDKDTQITNGNTPITLAALKPGALVNVKFSAQSGNRGVAREINVIAMPGAAFTFAGKLAYLDMHRGLLAVQNVDGKTYDIHFSPQQLPGSRNLMVGQQVTIVAVFEGSDYTAQSVRITGQPDAETKR